MLGDVSRGTETKAPLVIAGAAAVGGLAYFATRGSKPATTLPAPTGLRVVSTTSDGGVISWDPTPGAVKYVPYVGTIKLGAVRTTTATLTGIHNGPHPITIVAVDVHGGVSPASAPVTLTVPLLAVPTGLAVSAITASDFTVSWAAVPMATSYTAYLDGVPGSPLTTTAVVISGLTTKTHHRVQIQASDGTNRSNLSLPVTVTTL